MTYSYIRSVLRYTSIPFLLAMWYVIAYYSMVERNAARFTSGVVTVADYRVPYKWLGEFFYPIHALDRTIRNDFWKAKDRFLQ